MNEDVKSLADVVDEADERLRGGTHAAARVWPTGFATLDDHLAGGFRSGDLVLLTGPQGLGKTTFALQILRYVAQSGRAVVNFNFEHDPITMLQRLVAIESGEFAGIPAVGLDRIRRAFEGVDGSHGDLHGRLADCTGAPEALKAISTYSDRLLLHRSTGTTTTMEVIRETVETAREKTGQLPFIVVDYLQKVKVTNAPSLEDDRISRIVEGLKDMAMELDVPVLAIVAADKEGMSTGKRMRTEHMRGSSSLAYEADTVLVMNEKFDVVARHHLVYDTRNADRYRDFAVISIDKNRNGVDKIDLEFRKRFNQGRFETEGKRVAEQLIDERVFVD